MQHTATLQGLLGTYAKTTLKLMRPISWSKVILMLHYNIFDFSDSLVEAYSEVGIWCEKRKILWRIAPLQSTKSRNMDVKSRKYENYSFQNSHR